MLLKYLFTLASIALITEAHAASSFYCPQNHAYINAGMSQEQVLQACGIPTSRRSGGGAVTQQIPVTQLVYSTINEGPMSFYPGIAPIYNMWSLPSGSQGINIQVNLVQNRVADISLNQSPTNAVSACSGGSFQVGDDISKVFAACGSPEMINNTYIEKPVPKDQNPEVWVYTLPYQPSVTLTFINGILQSIF